MDKKLRQLLIVIIVLLLIQTGISVYGLLTKLHKPKKQVVQVITNKNGVECYFDFINDRWYKVTPERIGKNADQVDCIRLSNGKLYELQRMED